MMRDYLVVDLEFTHYTKPVGRPRGFFSEVLEIGAVLIDGNTHEVTGHIEDFVKPQFFPKQALEAMEFCMITQADMENAIDFIDMLEQIKSLYIPGKTYFVAWGDADYNVIDRGCAQYDVPNPILKEDYLDLAVAYKKLKNSRRTLGLRETAEELGVAGDGYWHTAYDDAYNTGLVLLKIIEGGWRPEDYF